MPINMNLTPVTHHAAAVKTVSLLPYAIITVIMWVGIIWATTYYDKQPERIIGQFRGKNITLQFVLHKSIIMFPFLMLVLFGIATL